MERKGGERSRARKRKRKRKKKTREGEVTANRKRARSFSDLRGITLAAQAFTCHVYLAATVSLSCPETWQLLNRVKQLRCCE